MANARVRIGTAGWATPRAVAAHFPAEGSGLQRYAGRFRAVEINTSFYRPHRPSTYARWGAQTPPDFGFSLKAPRAITHDARLQGCSAGLQQFLEDVSPLGDKFAVLLIQLPPSLAFEPAVADSFFRMLRRLDRDRRVVCEPRHASWFEPPADRLLAEHRVARAAADPARHPLAFSPGGSRDFAYYRLHGSPRMYYSSYAGPRLRSIAETLAAEAVDTWCIFDNTTSGAAAADALALQALLAA